MATAPQALPVLDLPTETPAPAVVRCTLASHDALRRDPVAWKRDTENVREWRIGGMVLDTRDCRRCGSTLHRRVGTYEMKPVRVGG